MVGQLFGATQPLKARETADTQQSSLSQRHGLTISWLNLQR